MSIQLRWSCLLALPFLFGCPPSENGDADPGGEDLTVVVEADKSQILQQEEELKANQSTLEKERDRLSQEREDVLNKISSLSKKDRKRRKELEGEQTRIDKEENKLRSRMKNFDKEREELEQKKTDLLQKIAALTGKKGSDVAALAKRIRALEENQKKLLEAQADNTRAILAAVRGIPSPSHNQVRTVSVSSGNSSSKGQVGRLESNIRAKMKAKGIVVADLPPAGRDYRTTAQKAAKTKDWSSAHDAFTQLESIVSSIKVDHAFVQNKFHRINKAYEGKMKSLNATKKTQVLALLDDVSDSFSDGRYDKANRKINRIHSLLE